MRASRPDDAALVAAAQAGDRRARDQSRVALHPVVATVAAGALAVGATVTVIRLADPAPPAVYAALPAAAPAATPTRTTSVGPPPSATLAAGGAVSLESANRPGRFVAVDADAGVLAAAGPRSDAATRVRVTFRVVDGLADAGCLSFRAPDGRHLRHSSWRVRLQPDDGTALYRGDATFCPRPAEEPGTLALESANYPGWFLRHVGDDLWVDRSDGSAGFRADSAFRVRAPLAG